MKKYNATISTYFYKTISTSRDNKRSKRIKLLKNLDKKSKIST